MGIPGIVSHENGIPPSGLGGWEISWVDDLKEEDEFEDDEEEEDDERDGVLRDDDGHLGFAENESSFFLPFLLATSGCLVDMLVGFGFTEDVGALFLVLTTLF